MDYTALYFCLREDCTYGISKSGKAIYRHYHDIFNPSVLNLIQDTEPVFGAFVPANPHAENLLVSIEFDTDSHVCGLLDGLIFLVYINI